MNEKSGLSFSGLTSRDSGGISDLEPPPQTIGCPIKSRSKMSSLVLLKRGSTTNVDTFEHSCSIFSIARVAIVSGGKT